MLRKFNYNKTKCIELMSSIAKENGLQINFLKYDEGNGGFNYGASAGKYIYLAPFVKSSGNRTINGITINRPCANPMECMLASFFHELAHCKLSRKVPGSEKKYDWNRTSKFQYELWITMLGLEYARKKGIVFSDETVKWLIEENFSYARPHETGNYNIVARKVTGTSYELVQDDFLYEQGK